MFCENLHSSTNREARNRNRIIRPIPAKSIFIAKKKPERKAPAFERNPDRLRALGNPLRFARTLANYETVNLAKIVI